LNSDFGQIYTGSCPTHRFRIPDLTEFGKHTMLSEH
jgi:hypothetical protein